MENMPKDKALIHKTNAFKSKTIKVIALLINFLIKLN